MVKQSERQIFADRGITYSTFQTSRRGRRILTARNSTKAFLLTDTPDEEPPHSPSPKKPDQAFGVQG